MFGYAFLNSLSLAFRKSIIAVSLRSLRGITSAVRVTLTERFQAGETALIFQMSEIPTSIFAIDLADVSARGKFKNFWLSENPIIRAFFPYLFIDS